MRADVLPFLFVIVVFTIIGLMLWDSDRPMGAALCAGMCVLAAIGYVMKLKSVQKR
jgi:hypothetical protein